MVICRGASGCEKGRQRIPSGSEEVRRSSQGLRESERPVRARGSQRVQSGTEGVRGSS